MGVVLFVQLGRRSNMLSPARYEKKLCRSSTFHERLNRFQTIDYRSCFIHSVIHQPSLKVMITSSIYAIINITFNIKPLEAVPEIG